MIRLQVSFGRARAARLAVDQSTNPGRVRADPPRRSRAPTGGSQLGMLLRNAPVQKQMLE